MLKDTHKRKIDYLRISVTDRCNLRCICCMPEYGIEHKSPRDILTFEEISGVVRLAVPMGVDKIRLTGGEPLARKGLPQLIEFLSPIPGLKDLSITTNGILLAGHVKALKKAGLRRINVSMDTLDDKKFRFVTGEDKLEDVLEGIEAARQEGLFVKINIVVMKGINDNEIFDFVKFGQDKQIIVRFIELMPMVSSIAGNAVSYSSPHVSCQANNNIEGYNYYGLPSFISCGEIKDRLRAIGEFKESGKTLGQGNGPAKYYTLGDRPIAIGFISPISHKFCSDCNRLRLTSDGLIMPCLGSSSCFDLKRALRDGNAEEARELMKEAIFHKPQEHNFTSTSFMQCVMSQVGG